MYYTVIKHSGHLETLEKCRKHSPAARVFYISLVFSNARRVLSQCNTRLRLLYLLNIITRNESFNRNSPCTIIEVLQIRCDASNFDGNFDALFTLRINNYKLYSA